MTVPIRRNTAGQSINVALFDSAGVLLINPTIAAGDFQVSTDDGAFGNLTTLPVVNPANGGQVVVALSQAETNGDKIGIRWIDQAGAEWMSGYLFILTSTASLADLCTLGVGAITEVYTLTDSGTGLPVADADIWVTSDLAGTNVLASGQTDQFGQVTFYLDAGTVYVWRQKSGYNFTNPDVEVVAP